MKSVMTLPVNDKAKHVLKFITFLKKNYNMPFSLKKRVAEACIVSALTYGCESWLTANSIQSNSIFYFAHEVHKFSTFKIK